MRNCNSDWEMEKLFSPCCTHPPMVEFVFLDWPRRGVPRHQDGEGGGRSGRDVGGGGGEVHLGLGGDGQGVAGEAGALLVVSHHPDGVGGAWQEPLQRDLLQGAPRRVDDPLSEQTSSEWHGVLKPTQKFSL